MSESADFSPQHGEGIGQHPQDYPPQYAEGKAYFRYIEVAVDQRVLIPRPETEELVTVAFGLLNSEVACPLIADICTGSGCIACSVAHEIPGARVIATDISPEALQVARKNAQSILANLAAAQNDTSHEAAGQNAQSIFANLAAAQNDTSHEAAGQNAYTLAAPSIEFYEGNLGDPIPLQYMGQFDLVISNPPYVPSGIIPTLDNMVKNYEPMLALDGGEDGLRLLPPLLEWCAKALKPGAPFAIELHEESLEAACAQAEALGFQNVATQKDLAGRPRILTGYKS